MNLIFVGPAWVKINNITYCHDVLLIEQSSYCMSCVRSLASSLSSSKTVFLHTEHTSLLERETLAFNH